MQSKSSDVNDVQYQQIEIIEANGDIAVDNKLKRLSPSKLSKKHTHVLTKDDRVDLIHRDSFFYGWNAENYLFLLATCCLFLALVRSFVVGPIGAATTNCMNSVHEETGELVVAKEGDGTGDYCVCPRNTICATSTRDMVFLGLARGSAYFDYPFYMLMFLSKANNLRNYLQSTMLSIYISFHESHDLHRLGGTIIGYEVCWHTFWHALRWSLNGQLKNFLFGTQTGITGFICFLLTFAIVWPMKSEYIKEKLCFETRKMLHMLSWLWGLCIIFHAPATHIAIIMGLCVSIYVADFIYGCFLRTFFIETSSFTRLEGAVEFSFIAPKSMNMTDFRAGYIYLCIPWISPTQWHAFSVYKSDDNSNRICACIAKNGSWTKALHKAVAKPTMRPCWAYGPFISPFGKAVNFDNVFCIASGIGITPAISVINAYRATKKVHLIWSCRDPSLVEWFLDNTTFDDDAWTCIFYTGKRELVLKRKLAPGIIVLKGRPNYEWLISTIISATEQGTAEVPQVLALSSINNSEESNDAYCDYSSEITRLLAMYPGDEGAQELYEMGIEIEQRIRAAAALSIATTTGITIQGKEVCYGISYEALKQLLNGLIQNPNKYPPEIIDSALVSMYRKIDINGDQEIDEMEFMDYMRLLLESYGEVKEEGRSTVDKNMIGNEFQRRLILGVPTNTSSTSDSTTQMKGVEIIDGEKWAMAYCGGSKAIVEQLEKVSAKYNIALEIEKFDW